MTKDDWLPSNPIPPTLLRKIVTEVKVENIHSPYGHNPRELVNIEQYQSQSNEYFSTGIMEMFIDTYNN